MPFDEEMKSATSDLEILEALAMHENINDNYRIDIKDEIKDDPDAPGFKEECFVQLVSDCDSDSEEVTT